jgi:hypothetical protein
MCEGFTILDSGCAALRTAQRLEDGLKSTQIDIHDQFQCNLEPNRPVRCPAIHLSRFAGDFAGYCGS